MYIFDCKFSVFISMTSVSNRAVIISLLVIVLTAVCGRFAAADDLTHSQTNEDSFSHKAVSDLHDQSNTAGDTEPAIRYSLHITGLL